MAEKDIITEDFIFERFFSKEPYSARLWDLFKVSALNWDKTVGAINAFIQVHDKFYHFDSTIRKWIVITITFKRSGVVFYKAKELQDEHHFEIGSAMSTVLVPVTIDVNRLIDIMSPLHNIDKAKLLQMFKERGFKYENLSITVKY